MTIFTVCTFSDTIRSPITTVSFCTCPMFSAGKWISYSMLDLIHNGSTLDSRKVCVLAVEPVNQIEWATSSHLLCTGGWDKLLISCSDKCHVAGVLTWEALLCHLHLSFVVASGIEIAQVCHPVALRSLSAVRASLFTCPALLLNVIISLQQDLYLCTLAENPYAIVLQLGFDPAVHETCVDILLYIIATALLFIKRVIRQYLAFWKLILSDGPCIYLSCGLCLKSYTNIRGNSSCYENSIGICNNTMLMWC